VTNIFYVHNVCQVFFECGPDRYGRTLGEVFVDGKSVNLEMIKAGLAEVYRGKPASGQNIDP
jgi:endonuclease YncB( thermonuclease family)